MRLTHVCDLHMYVRKIPSLWGLHMCVWLTIVYVCVMWNLRLISGVFSVYWDKVSH